MEEVSPLAMFHIFDALHLAGKQGDEAFNLEQGGSEAAA